METIIPCRNCDHPLKSGSCLGCNVFRLYEALQRGKLDWAKDEHNGIVESKLEQPTVSPDDVRGVVHCHECSHAYKDLSGAIYCTMWDAWEVQEDGFCYKGAKMKGAEDGTAE